MKNLKIKFSKGEDLTALPDDKSVRNERYGRRWSSKNDVYHKVDGISPWKRIKRILNDHIGKPFDTAFSIYCSQVPVYQQKFFIDELDNNIHNRWGRSELWDYFYVDKNGCIQKHLGTYHQRKKILGVDFYSDDYKTERRHKVTGAKLPEYYWWEPKKYKESDYVDTIIQGYVLHFSSAKDPEYKRLIADQRKRRDAARRAYEKEAEKKSYSFISKKEIELKKEKAIDKVKIEAKGFDYETSFRTEKQTNPDTIKDRQ